MPRVVVATDGSSLGNPGPAGWAWVVHKNCWSSGGLPRATNQAAELFAILAALRAIPRTVPIHIKTDSAYCLKAFSKWVPAWKANSWRKSNGEKIANITLVKEIDRLLNIRSHKVTWELVKGHSGDKLNEAADYRCTEASKAIKEKTTVNAGPGWTTPPSTRAATRTASSQRSKTQQEQEPSSSQTASPKASSSTPRKTASTKPTPSNKKTEQKPIEEAVPTKPRRRVGVKKKMLNNHFIQQNYRQT
jgi:ribonuclease HI